LFFILGCARENRIDSTNCEPAHNSRSPRPKSGPTCRLQSNRIPRLDLTCAEHLHRPWRMCGPPGGLRRRRAPQPEAPHQLPGPRRLLLLQFSSEVSAAARRASPIRPLIVADAGNCELKDRSGRRHFMWRESGLEKRLTLTRNVDLTNTTTYILVSTTFNNS
jgi:hypothetical protein